VTIEVRNDAAEIVIEAECGMGTILKNSEKNKGGRPSKNGQKNQFHDGTGLPRTSSMRFQHMASVPEKARKEYIAKTREAKQEVTSAAILRLSKQQVRQNHRATKATLQTKADKSFSEAQFKDVCDIRHCSMADLFSSGIKPDAVITDPPYPKKFIPLYGELAELCVDVPIVAVLCGQSYLPEILSDLSKHLRYRWTMAYLTPGGQAVQQWQAKVNTFWKPVLLFGKAAEWIGDVCRSEVNDNDKRFHDWGKSESGMADLVERLTKPNDLVCDPFLGGGTTAMACISLSRRFVGCDIDKKTVATAAKRISSCLK